LGKNRSTPQPSAWPSAGLSDLNKAGWRMPLRRQWVAMQPLRRPLGNFRL
jgi:hypothetical protein